MQIQRHCISNNLDGNEDEILLQMDPKKVLVMMRTDARIKLVHEIGKWKMLHFQINV